MRRFSKILAFGMAACMAATAFVGCGSTTSSSGSSSDAPAASGDAAKGKVYFLNFKPEQDKQWQDLAKAYTDETGTQVKVLTAAEGKYEETLTSEMDKGNDAPTMFQVNGPVGYANWKDFCYDLAGSDLYKEVKSDDFVLKDGDKIPGIAYVIETYGIIYNKTLLDKYFASDFATIKKIDDLNNFNALKTVAEEIQKNKDALGVDGAFTSAGMDGSSDWRFKTHLANMPIYYEYKDKGIGSTDAIEGTYLDNYKNIWDLYINNGTCAKTELASKTGTDADTEFKTGKAVFYQNGTWAYDAIKLDDKNVGLKDEELGMLPIYIGAKGEENQGLCTGSENYWCVNAKASADDIAATLAFMKWCVSSEKGTKALAEDMKFVIPFKAAKAATNPLVAVADQYVADGKKSVSWNFATIPSEDWKNGVGAALTQYAAGTSEWDAVKTAFVDGWKTEYAKAH